MRISRSTNLFFCQKSIALPEEDQWVKLIYCELRSVARLGNTRECAESMEDLIETRLKIAPEAQPSV